MEMYFFLWELLSIDVSLLSLFSRDTLSLQLSGRMEGTAEGYKAALHKYFFKSHSRICCLIWATERSGFERDSEWTAMPKNLITTLWYRFALGKLYSLRF